MQIAVIMGGVSNEKEVSLKTGEAILKGLKELNYNVFPIYLKEKNYIEELRKHNFDLAFLALHGEFGEDGKIQSVLEFMNKKYTGSKVTASAIAIDKELTKIILNYYGVKSAKTYKNLDEINEYPVIIKPKREGSSVGLHICKNKKETENAIKELNGKKIIIEEFIKGYELTSAVLGNEPLGVLRIKAKSGTYDYQSKYTKGMTEYEYPAKINKEIYQKTMEYALIAHNALGLSSYSRSDFILKDNEIYFLEVNTLPGMTETSLLPKLASLKNYSFNNLLEKIIDTSN